MIFYKRFIGDYHGKTAGLVAVEHGVYSLLLDAFYATEKPLPLDDDELCVIARAFDDVSRAAVRKVLDRYWRETPDGWVNSRALEEIVKAKELQAAQKARAGKRWNGRGTQ